MSSKTNNGRSGSGRKPRFPELPPKYSSSRELRNKAEKMRRDRLNKLIEEMRSLVPMICNKTKKSETTRSNILRLTANYLRVTQLFPDNVSDNTAAHPEHTSLGEGVPHLESMEGFFFILSEDGRILYVSQNVDKFVGFSQIEMMGHPIHHFLHPADQSKLNSHLPRGDKMSTDGSSPNSPPDMTDNRELKYEKSPDPDQNKSRLNDRQSFYIRMREKPLAKNDSPQYEHMHVVGRLKKRQGELGDTNTSGLSHFIFIGVMKPVRDRPITELSLMESVQDQYITRHLPDGRFIYADHRISTIAGYFPSEVIGKSAFNYFCPEDLPWTTMALRHMFASSNGEGTTVYRLFTQTGEMICLQSRGFLEFNKTTNKIETFLCINTLIRPEDSEKYLNEQKDKFSPFITELQINTMTNTKTHGLTFSPSSIPSTPNSKVSKHSTASSPPSIPQSLAVSVISQTQPTTSSSQSLPPLHPLLKCQNTQSTGNGQHSETSSEEDIKSLSSVVTPRPKPEQSVTRMLSPNKRSSLEAGLESGGSQSKVKHAISTGHYKSRRTPTHRIEEGARVLDIEGEEDKSLSKVNFMAPSHSMQDEDQNTNQYLSQHQHQQHLDLNQSQLDLYQSQQYPGQDQQNTRDRSRSPCHRQQIQTSYKNAPSSQRSNSVIQMYNPSKPVMQMNHRSSMTNNKSETDYEGLLRVIGSNQLTSESNGLHHQGFNLNKPISSRDNGETYTMPSGEVIPLFPDPEDDLLDFVNPDNLLFPLPNIDTNSNIQLNSCPPT